MNPNQGRKVHFINWPNASELTAKDGITMHYQNDYHGDHDENWVIVTRNGSEIARHNTRFIESIVWEDSKPEGT